MKYKNPVIDLDFADPSIIKADDGKYYLYGTRSYAANNHTHIQVAHSTDFFHWTYVGEAMPQKPSWAQNTIEFWAPHVLYANGMYFLYFSTQKDGGEEFCIGVACSKNPAGPFIPVDTPIMCGHGFTTIDPMGYEDPISHKKYLIWGSGHGPIRIQELADDLISLKPGSTSHILLEPSDKPFENLIEGAYLFYKNDWYYLFYSGDDVWKQGRYAVMVARSKNILGPYEKKADALNLPDSVILRGNERWDSPGQNSIIEEKGRVWTFYHAVDLKKRLNERTNQLRRVVMMSEVTFENGWPKKVDSI